MTKTSVYPLLVLTAALVMTPLHAQKCERTDSYLSCWRRFNDPQTQEQRDAVAAAQLKRTQDTTANAATGLTSLASASESPLKDFLTLLAASLESAASSDTGNAFTFDWNPRLAVGSGLPALKVQAVVAEAKLHDEVTSRLEGNADAIANLTDDLEFGDDVTLSVSFLPRTRSYGRSMVPHRDWFEQSLFAIQAQDPLADDDAELLLEKLGIDTANLDTPFSKLPDPDNPTQVMSDDQIKAVEDEARSFQRESVAVAKFTGAFSQLLNNQPQFYVSALYRARQDVVGPNEWSLKVTYEMAGNNLNAFQKRREECRTMRSESDASDCAHKMEAFAKEATGGIERIALALEYRQANARLVTDPGAELEVSFPETNSFLGSISFGAFVNELLPLGFVASPNATAVGNARVDLALKYELPEDDDSETRGFVGSLMYSQKVSETFSLPLSLVYSDHESDLLNVDKRFSVRFGLMYKLSAFK